MGKYVLAGGKHDEMGDSLKYGRIFRGEVIEGLGLTTGTGMDVKLLPGTGRIPTGSGLGSFYWPFLIDTSGGETLTAGTADGTNARWDVVVLYLIAANNSTTPTNNPTSLGLALVPGTPASSPTEPNDSAIQAVIGASRPYVVLWRVQVPAGTSSSASFTLVDKRNMMKLGIGAPYLDAKGWTVYDFGTYKEYRKNFNNDFASSAVAGNFSYVAFDEMDLPVGITSLDNVYHQASGRTDNVNVVPTSLRPGSGASKFDIRGNNFSTVSQNITQHRICVFMSDKTGS